MLNRLVERLTAHRGCTGEQKIIGQDRLLAFFLFRIVDNPVKHPGIVIQVLEIQVLGQGLGETQLAVFEIVELFPQVTAEGCRTREQYRQPGLVELDRLAADTHPVSQQRTQQHQRGAELGGQHDAAADHGRHADQQLVL